MTQKLFIFAKFPGSVGDTQNYVIVDEGLKREKLELLLNQPFIQRGMNTSFNGKFHLVEKMEWGSVVRVNFMEVSQREFKQFRLSFIMKGDGHIRQSSIPRVILYAKKPEDLSYIMNGESFKNYLILEMVSMNDLPSGVESRDYKLSIEEISLSDGQLIVYIEPNTK